jgi:hypothetical protein
MRKPVRNKLRRVTSTRLRSSGEASDEPSAMAVFHQYLTETGSEVTNGRGPVRQNPSNFYGNGSPAVDLWPNGTKVFRPHGGGFVKRDGSLGMKFAWCLRHADRKDR